MIKIIQPRHRMLRNKVKSPRQYPEFVIHSHIADYCAKMFIPGSSMWHTTEVSTGAGAEARERQAKLKFLGAKKGFPDGLIFYKESTFDTNGIILIEIKSLTGVLSHEQKEMHEILKDMGFIVEVVRSLDNFVKVVNNYNVPTREHKYE